MSRWQSYFDDIGDTTNPFVEQVLERYVSQKNAALDLGAGKLNDAKLLKSRGFKRVVAVDPAVESLSYADSSIELVTIAAEEYVFETNVFDFIVSINTLYFLPKIELPRLFSAIRDALSPHGVFVCNLLGDRDGRVKSGRFEAYGFTKDEVESLCREYRVHILYEKSPGFQRMANGLPNYNHEWLLVLGKE